VKHALIPQRNLDIRAARAAGESYESIAARHDLTVSWVSQICCASFQIKRPRAIKPPDARALRMIEMYRSGLTLAQIGQRYDVTRERARQILRKYGCAPDEGGRTKRGNERRASRNAIADAKAYRKYGCSLAECRQIKAAGGTMAFSYQRRAAHMRGIKWGLMLKQWWDLWQQSGHWSERGRGAAKYCMARVRDRGDYEVGNVYITTARENGQEYQKSRYRTSVRLYPVGVTNLYPGTDRPFLAKIGKKWVGRFATPEEAKAARESHPLFRGDRKRVAA